VAVGRCDDLGVPPPYGPWLDARSRLSPGDGAISAAARASAPAEQLGETFTAAAARQPLLLALEDLRWADPASIDFLRALARRVESLPLLIVVTYRADELSRDHPLRRAPLHQPAHRRSALALDLHQAGCPFPRRRHARRRRAAARLTRSNA
jgi:hypothetical protein